MNFNSENLTENFLSERLPLHFSEKDDIRNSNAPTLRSILNVKIDLNGLNRS